MMSRYDDDDDAVTTPAPEAEIDAAPAAPRDVVPPEVQANVGRVIRKGWGAADATRAADSPFAQRLTVTQDAVVVKFLDDEPYASFRSHWIEGRTGQKSFTCLDGIDPKGCPLCDAGNRPSAKFAFNVALMDPSGDPTNKSYEIGPRIIDALKNFHNDPRQGPLSKHYWAVSRTGKGSTSQTSHQMVKERDLESEWGIDPITPEQMVELQKRSYDFSIIQVSPRKSLLAIAAEDLGTD